jgi:hypothetical protein
MVATGEGTEGKVDHLVEVCYYHYDGEDLPKLPGIIDLNDTANVGPIPESYFVSMHLDRVQWMRLDMLDTGCSQ